MIKEYNSLQDNLMQQTKKRETLLVKVSSKLTIQSIHVLSQMCLSLYEEIDHYQESVIV